MNHDRIKLLLTQPEPERMSLGVEYNCLFEAYSEAVRQFELIEEAYRGTISTQQSLIRELAACNHKFIDELIELRQKQEVQSNAKTKVS